MTIEEMKEAKRQKGYTYEQVAQLSGVPLGTVQKIFCGETRAPRYATLQALEKVFRYERITYDFQTTSDKPGKPGMMQEEAVYQVAKEQGDYTIEDYYALPMDKRVELIDGVIYNMNPSTLVHREVAEEVYFQAADFFRKKKGEGIVKMWPIDVRLDCDNKTMVQPDMLILCDKNKVMRWGIMGAPDFILEVLSPATRKKDCFKKMVKYMEAGVKEYWIIDPDTKKLVIYRFEEEICPVIYDLQGKVPVGIYHGALEIDLDLVAETMQDCPNDGEDD